MYDLSRLPYVTSQITRFIISGSFIDFCSSIHHFYLPWSHNERSCMCFLGGLVLPSVFVAALILSEFSVRSGFAINGHFLCVCVSLYVFILLGSALWSNPTIRCPAVREIIQYTPQYITWFPLGQPSFMISSAADKVVNQSQTASWSYHDCRRRSIYIFQVFYALWELVSQP